MRVCRLPGLLDGETALLDRGGTDLIKAGLRVADGAKVKTPGLRASILIVLGLSLAVAVLPDHPVVRALAVAAVLGLGGLRSWAPLRDLMNARRLSRKMTLALVGAFAIALVAAGHGVAPVAFFLVWGWERFPGPTVLAWLAILLLGSSALLRSPPAPVLGFSGGIVALVAWALLQALSDEPLAGTLGSLPFLGCLLLHSIHLWRIRSPERAPSA